MTTTLFEGRTYSMKMKNSPVACLNNQTSVVTLQYFHFAEVDKNKILAGKIQNAQLNNNTTGR